MDLLEQEEDMDLLDQEEVEDLLDQEEEVDLLVERKDVDLLVVERVPYPSGVARRMIEMWHSGCARKKIERIQRSEE